MSWFQFLLTVASGMRVRNILLFQQPMNCFGSKSFGPTKSGIDPFLLACGLVVGVSLEFGSMICKHEIFTWQLQESVAF